jgi:hypothetical protein
MSTEEEILALQNERILLQGKLEIAIQQQLAYQQAVTAPDVQSPPAAATFGAVGPGAGDVTYVALDQQTMTQAVEHALPPQPPAESPESLQSQISSIDAQIKEVQDRQVSQTQGVIDSENDHIKFAETAHELELSKEAIEKGVESLQDALDHVPPPNPDHVPPPNPPTADPISEVGVRPDDVSAHAPLDAHGADPSLAAVIIAAKLANDMRKPVENAVEKAQQFAEKTLDKVVELANDAKEYVKEAGAKVLEVATDVKDWATDKEGMEVADLSEKQTKAQEDQADRHADERLTEKTTMDRLQNAHDITRRNDPPGKPDPAQDKLNELRQDQETVTDARQAAEYLNLLAEQEAARQALTAQQQGLKQTPPPTPPPVAREHGG